MKRSFFLLAIVGLLVAGCGSENDQNNTKTGPADDEQIPATNIKNPNTANQQSDYYADGYPEMTFEKTHHNFGKIKQGEKVEYAFKFVNTGGANLIINSATATCGCTVPDYPKHPVPPGEEGVIPVVFNSAGKSNHQQKTITITANTNPNITTLTIETFIETAY